MKVIKLLFTLAIFLNHFYGYGQTTCTDFVWAKGLPSTSATSGNAIVSDTLGNTYTVGYFTGTANFGSYSLTSSGGKDVFITKTNSSGTVLWAKKGGGNGDDEALDIAITPDGKYIYTTGYFSSTAYFGIPLQSAGWYDIFLVGLETTGGNFHTAYRAGGSANDVSRALALDSSGIYLAGFFSSSMTIGTTTHYAKGGSDLFIMKFVSGSGIPTVVKAGSNTNSDWATDISIQNNYIYLSGTCGSNATFGSTTLPTAGGFVSKLDNSLNFLWTKKIGSTTTPASIATDGYNHTYILGDYVGADSIGNTGILNKGGTDIFLSLLDSQGNINWTKTFGTTGTEFGKSILLDQNRNIFITGAYSGHIMFDSISLYGSDDIYLAKLDSNGSVSWAYKASGYHSDICNAICCDNKDNLYLTGYSTSLAIFGNHTVTNTSNRTQAFVARFTYEQLIVNPMAPLNVKCGSGVVLPGSAKGFQSLQWIPSTGINDPYSLKPALITFANINIRLKATNYCGDTASQPLSVRIDTFTIDPTLSLDTIVCGNSVQLSANLLPSNYSGVNFSWSPHNGLSLYNIANPIASPIETTTYTLTARNLCGHSVTKPVSVIVNPYTLQAKCSDSIIYCGTSTQLEAIISPEISNLNFNWTPSKGLANTNTASPESTPNITTIYAVVATSPVGCTATDSVQVTIIPYTVSTLAAQNTINCGTSTQLSARVTPSIPNLSFNWSPSKSLSDALISDPIASPGLSTKYIATASTPNGCSASDNLSITVNNPNPPKINIVSNTSDFDLCSNGLILSTQQAFATYEWSTGATTPSIHISEPGMYTVIAYEASGCAGIDSVNIKPLQPIFTPNGTILCPNLTDQKLQLIAPDGYNNYTWNTGEQTRSITVENVGTYKVNASKGTCQYNKDISVDLSNGSAQADFTNTNNGLTVTFTAISQSINFLSWEFGDGSSSFETNPVYTYEEPGEYDVKITITDICGNSAEKTKTINVSQASLHNSEHQKARLFIYPNPSTGEITIKRSTFEVAHLEVYNALGKLIYTEQINGESSTFYIESSGIYYIKIKSQDNKTEHAQKIIISN